MLPVDQQQRADAELGAALRRAEAALPANGWLELRGPSLGADRLYQVTAYRPWPPERPVIAGEIARPTALPLIEALDALTEALHGIADPAEGRADSR